MLRRKRWKIESQRPPENDWGIPLLPPEIAEILLSRGVDTAEQAGRFLRREPPGESDPARLAGSEAAVDRILRATRSGERTAIYGDYDTDGVTATALLVSYLSSRGGRAFPYIPSRMEEGYGLNLEALRKLREEEYRLVITVDCGVRSLEEAEEARKIGLDLIITDHHEALDQLPVALAVVDPKIPGDGYPDKSLAGVGVAYKLTQAIEAQLARSGVSRSPNLERYLELVALGTVADLAPLVGENRSLVARGLTMLNAGEGPRNLGLRKLMEASSLRPGQVTAGTIGFVLGPRLNSAGRVEHALSAYSLLTSESPQKAAELAALLSKWNRQRQEITRTVTLQARNQIVAPVESRTPAEVPFFLFASDSSFHPGVIGLAASRLSEEFYRPAAVVTVDSQSGLARGSARSIPEFPLIQALDQCSELLVHHGGHAAAAGFTVRQEDLPALRARLESLARAELAPLALEPCLKADLMVSLGRLPELAAWVKEFEPCGVGNPAPVFVTPRVRVVSKRVVGGEGRHLMLRLGEGKATLEAIAFGRGPDAGRLPDEVAVAFRLEEDDYGGVNRLRLNILDMADPGSDENLPGGGKTEPSPRSGI